MGWKYQSKKKKKAKVLADTLVTEYFVSYEDLIAPGTVQTFPASGKYEHVHLQCTEKISVEKVHWSCEREENHEGPHEDFCGPTAVFARWYTDSSQLC